MAKKTSTRRRKKTATASKRSKKKIADGTTATQAPAAEMLRRFVRAKGGNYLKDPNITSIGVGLKNGNGPVCLQFTVGSKGQSAIESLNSRPIPKSIQFEGVEIPTDVLERKFEPSYRIVSAESLNDRRVRLDPIVPGISIANTRETAGTLGLIVFNRESGAPCVLSNWHVLHGNNGAIGDVVVQPGPFDDNDVSGNECGILMRSHLGAAGDCALARIRGREFSSTVIDLNVAPKRMAEVSLGDHVIKSGRTTGNTNGLVRRVDVLAKINYGGSIGEQQIGCF